MRTNVYAYAKRDLRGGEVLDGIGGYACYGQIEESAGSDEHAGVPICLCEGMTLRRAIRKDEKLLMSDVDFDANSFEYRLFADAARIPGGVAG